MPALTYKKTSDRLTKYFIAIDYTESEEIKTASVPLWLNNKHKLWKLNNYFNSIVSHS